MIIKRLNKILKIVYIIENNALLIIFSMLYYSLFLSADRLIITLILSTISLFTILLIFFVDNDNKILIKYFFLTSFVIFVAIFILYLLKKYNLFSKFTSVESLREYISSFGNLSIVVFIVLQFLQVVILPIPAIITVGAGVLLFGPFKGALFSYFGIVLGSLFAYFFGKIFGVKVVKWLIGESKVDKAINSVSGKSNIIFTFMFLFPFFPDDLLCFVAGIISMNSCFFITMIILVRFITIFLSSLSIGNSLIPYNTVWGIIIWIIIFLLIAVVLVFFFIKLAKRKTT